MTARQETETSPDLTAADGETPPGPHQHAPAATAGPQEMAPLTGEVTAPPPDARQLEAEIERTREQLGETVQELVFRVDLKSRAQAKAAAVSGKVKDTTAQVRDNAAARAKDVMDAQERWVPLAAGGGVLIVGLLILFSQWKRQH